VHNRCPEGTCVQGCIQKFLHGGPNLGYEKKREGGQNRARARGGQ
jgi:hypothetical protein